MWGIKKRKVETMEATIQFSKFEIRVMNPYETYGKANSPCWYVLRLCLNVKTRMKEGTVITSEVERDSRIEIPKTLWNESSVFFDFQSNRFGTEDALNGLNSKKVDTLKWAKKDSTPYFLKGVKEVGEGRRVGTIGSATIEKLILNGSKSKKERSKEKKEELKVNPKPKMVSAPPHYSEPETIVDLTSLLLGDVIVLRGKEFVFCGFTNRGLLKVWTDGYLKISHISKKDEANVVRTNKSQMIDFDKFEKDIKS